MFQFIYFSGWNQASAESRKMRSTTHSDHAVDCGKHQNHPSRPAAADWSGSKCECGFEDLVETICASKPLQKKKEPPPSDELQWDLTFKQEIRNIEICENQERWRSPQQMSSTCGDGWLISCLKKKTCDLLHCSATITSSLLFYFIPLGVARKMLHDFNEFMSFNETSVHPNDTKTITEIKFDLSNTFCLMSFSGWYTGFYWSYFITNKQW